MNSQSGWGAGVPPQHAPLVSPSTQCITAKQTFTRRNRWAQINGLNSFSNCRAEQACRQQPCMDRKGALHECTWATWRCTGAHG